MYKAMKYIVIALLPVSIMMLFSNDAGTKFIASVSLVLLWAMYYLAGICEKAHSSDINERR